MIGETLSHYKITAKIGQGGMGEVYRARDSRLDRDVAVKVLSEQRIDSAEAQARFEREAKAVAALSHPNILEIYDVGEHEGVAYAVTELLEGKTLLEQLDDGPLPLRKTLEYAGQMADGLAAAHDSGIIHRDLKPGNIFLTADGRLKILDFGLAKTERDSDLAARADTVQDSTAPGTVLGTARYMSPEQVRADAVDFRSDIFSFGTVLWEMLTGKVAFKGDSAVETMHAVLHEDPPSSAAINHSIPVSLDRIIHRCLEKSPNQRFQSARDLAFALRNSSDSSVQSAITAPIERQKSSPRLMMMVFLVLFGAIAGAFLMRTFGGNDAPSLVKVYPLTHSGGDSAPSASPDGNLVAFVSNRDGTDRIWIRQMKGGFETPLTEGIDIDPRFSPDGSSVLFLRDEGDTYSAFRVATVGGAPRKMLDGVGQACWSADGTRLAFIRPAGSDAEPAFQVGIFEIGSGKTTQLATFENRSIYGLDWSPDGDWLAISSSAMVMNNNVNAVLLVHARTGEVQEAFTSKRRCSAALWTRDSRQLIFAESMSLLGDISGAMGQVLRVDAFSDKSESLFWVQSVWGGSSDYIRFDRLGDGQLIFDEVLWRGSLTQVDIQGEAPFSEGERLTIGNSRYRQPAYSPDGATLVFSSNRSGNLDIWSIDLETRELGQITDDAADDWDPAISADGRSLIWSSNRGGNLEIWIADADGSGARQLSHDGIDAENPTQTADGAWVVYASGHPEHPGIWRVRTDGSETVQIVAGSYLLPEVSPDGKHVAYLVNRMSGKTTGILVSDLETGEVVFSTDVKFYGFQLATAVGRCRWMPDGKSIVFVAATEDGRTGLFEQDFNPGQDTLESRRLLIGAASGGDLETFGVSPDGHSITVGRLDHHRSLKVAEGDFGDR